MQEFFEKIYKTKLTRKDNGFYTLGDEALDHGIGLDQFTAVFSPSKQQIENFAALSFLYGILGYKASNFTAVPAGYLATYESETDSATLLVSEATVDEYRAKLIDLFDEKIKAHTVYEMILGDGEFYYLAKDLLLNKKQIMPDQENKLTHVCVALSDVLRNDYKKIGSKTKNAISLFNFNAENSLNKKNCDDNQLLIERICREILGYPVNESEATKDQIAESKDMGDKLLQNILVGYKRFMGDKIGNKPESQILSDNEFIDELLGYFKSTRNVVLILNICATDYTADVINNLLTQIFEGNKDSSNKLLNLEKQLKLVDEIVAETPNNFGKRNLANKHLHETGYMFETELNK